MAPIPAAPNDFRKCLIYQQLREKSLPGDGSVDKFELLVEYTAPLLDSIISGPFKYFTLHNRDHAKKLLHLCEYIVDEATLRALSSLECLVIAYAAYLHDLGMPIASPEDRDKILESQEFQDVLVEWPELSDAFQRSRKRLQEIMGLVDGSEHSEQEAAALQTERLRVEGDLFQLQEAAFVAYLRPRHATEKRYRELFSLLKKTSGRNDLFEFRGVSFEQQLINICISHNLDAGVLAEVRAPNNERFPRQLLLSGQRLNSQFCAAVLRIVDVLDFDRERTPRILFESLGISSRALPGAEVSLEEWQKHMAVHSMDIRRDEIVVAAECKHPVIEKSIREFCELIEREIRDTSTVLTHNTAEIAGAYRLQLPLLVRPQVTPVGYVYKEMSLVMNQVAIMSLLMGEHLYSQKGVALRELIQNSVDACVVREELSSEGSYQSTVRLSLHTDVMGLFWIEITDNGIGMDEHVLSEYFLKLGNSYYRSAEFSRLSGTAKQKHSFVPIARFGIGVASLFMIGDVVEVLTRASHSPRLDSVARLVRIERMGGLVFVEENVEWVTGTRIRVRLRPEIQLNAEQFLLEVRRYLREVVVRPKVKTTIELGGPAFSVIRQSWLKLKKTASDDLARLDLEIIQISLADLSPIISGFAFLVLRKANGKLSVPESNVYRTGFFNDRIFEGYTGNRVTVNGFKMALKGQKRLHSTGKISLPLTFDIEVQPDSSVIFDVPRDKLIGQTKPLIVNEFRSAVYRFLLQSGVLDKLDQPSRLRFDNVLLTRFPHVYHVYQTAAGIIHDEALLKRVQSALPVEAWPTGIHKKIAEDLNVSPGLVSRAISTLISRGLVSNPNPPKSASGAE
jgi:molecular chaperone HtpG